jgi:hypothetical protein
MHSFCVRCGVQFEEACRQLLQMSAGASDASPQGGFSRRLI